MTEEEWLACSDPYQMLEVVQDKFGERKFRLFACACWRRIWVHIKDQEGRHAVEVAELFAEGKADSQDLAEAYDPEYEGYVDWACTAAEPDANYAAHLATDHVADFVAQPTADDAPNQANFESERAAHCDLLRDIFGNPFVEFNIDDSKISGSSHSVLSIAAAIYEERRFDEMVVLGDALEESGCRNVLILSHCREPREHVRGCWVIDMILAKQ